MSLALRNLLQNKMRLALSVVGVALSVMLILILNGFLGGLYRQASTYLAIQPIWLTPPARWRSFRTASAISSQPALFSLLTLSRPSARPAVSRR